jgi:hypothetical protein
MNAVTSRTGSLLRNMVLASVILGAALISGVGLTAFPPLDGAMILVGMVAALGALIVLSRSGIDGAIGSSLVIAASLLAMTGVRFTSVLAVSDVFLFAGIGLAVLKTCNPKNRQLQYGALLIRGSLLLVLGSVIGGIFSSDPVESLNRVAKLSVPTVLIPVAILLWKPTIRNMQTIVWAFVFSATASSLVALVLGPGPFQTRATGLAGHANALALTALIALGPALIGALEGRSWTRLVGAFCCLTLLGGILVSGSRAGIIGAAATMLVLVILLGSRSGLIKIFVGAGLVTALVLIGVVQPPGDALQRLLTIDNTASGVAQSNVGRQEALLEGFRAIEERPFIGSGLAKGRAAHNVYLQVFASTGLIGFVGFLTVIWATMKPAFDLRSRRTVAISSSARVLVLGLCAGYAGFLVADLFQNALWERYMWLTPSLVAAMGPYLVAATVADTRYAKSLRSPAPVDAVSGEHRNLVGGYNAP